MQSRTQQTYVGIHNDLHGGMTPIGGIIKDAWVFELIPETETCEGWATAQIQVLHDKVNAAWDQYGLRVSNLPPEIRERHTRIHDQAIEKARSMGWVPGRDSDAEME
ncbi:hypothetical protein [Ectothiorhodospira marina]|uniref:Uncharacterized protein n=1 Tax=Ectothiorhodospira marina TaxID=1396821 RepID=A0A1H7MCS9_9GAMM|nr:hypothetical protein [Ectothiorhodospira marina]SEL08982.1 hypothetical protein SAMN05444515_10950 [Ectothiorhodospira marina]